MAPRCETCEVLKRQMDHLRFENQRLTQTIIQIAAPAPVEPLGKPVEYKPIQTATVPWRVKQQMLEAEDREANRLRKEKEKEREVNKMTTEELEAELGITPEPNPSNAA